MSLSTRLHESIQTAFSPIAISDIIDNNESIHSGSPPHGHGQIPVGAESLDFNVKLILNLILIIRWISILVRWRVDCPPTREKADSFCFSAIDNLASCYVPDVDHAICACADEEPTVWGELKANNRVGEPAEVLRFFHKGSESTSILTVF